MKWHKYSSLAATNPIAASILNSLVGPPMMRYSGTHPSFTLQKWVENQVDYVAIRPWKKLDLGATDESGYNSHTAYTLHYHIGGEERVCSRLRWMTDTECNLKTIAETVKEAVEWYGLYWASQPDRPLVFDAVARKSSVWQEEDRYSKERIDIWLAPEGFRP